MYVVSILTHCAGKPFNMLMVRPTKTMAREELKAIKSVDGLRVIGWIMWDNTGMCDSCNSSQCLPMDSREFDSYDVCYWTRY